MTLDSGQLTPPSDGGGTSPPARPGPGTAAGRWAIAASVLASGAVFLEATVVSVALPALDHEFGLGVTGLQWVVNGYLVTLGALLLLGGALGDAWGQKRTLEIGVGAFAVGSLLCAAAPSFSFLIAARLVQGAAGALLVPTSLAYLDTTFEGEDKATAIGIWAGWSAVSTALGPLVGGALLDFASWRWVFAAVAPIALAALWILRRRTPAPTSVRRGAVDWTGALLVSAALGATTWSLIAGSSRGATAPVLVTGAAGVAMAVLFLRVESRRDRPLLPLGMFRSRQFTGANVTTLLVYGALNVLFFFLMIQLQEGLGYGALAAGASLLPIYVLMILISPRAGRWAAGSGPGPAIVTGSVAAGVGLALLTRAGTVGPYATTILPGVVVFGAGLGLFVAPLTTSVLAVAEEGRSGIASAVNNAAARVAGLLAIALIPMLAGVGGVTDFSGPVFAAGFRRAMWIAAGLCVAGAAIAALTVTEAGPASDAPHPSPTHGCPRLRAEPDPATAG